MTVEGNEQRKTEIFGLSDSSVVAEQHFQCKAKTVTLSEEIQVIPGDTQENGRRSRVEKYSEFSPWEMNQVKIRKKYDLSQKGLRHQSSSGTNVK